MQKAFDRVLIVMFENQYRQYVMEDPFMKKLATAGADMANYFGSFHPSQTNYVASLAGEVCAVTNDIPPARPLMQETLVDVLEPAGISWKAYMEGYPGDPWKAAWKSPDYPASEQPLSDFPDGTTQLARYFRKHNAFASFHTIQSDEARWQKIVDERAFWNDIAAGALPEYGWFTPDIWNDGHYLYNTHKDTNPRTQLVPQMSAWLEYIFLGDIPTTDVQDALGASQTNWGLNLDIDLLLTDAEKAWKQSKVPAGTLIVITFDEADYDAEGYDTSYDGPNQVYTVLLGDMIQPGTVIETPFNHYSLMKTIQRNFGTKNLGKNDREANWFRFLWNQHFEWAPSGDIGLSSSGDLSVAGDGNGVCLVCVDAAGELVSSDFNGTAWSPGVATGIQGGVEVALASCQGRTLLVTSKEDGELFAAVREGRSRWSTERPLGQKTAGGIAISSYLDHADGQEKAMLCWQSETGFIKYLEYAEGVWRNQAGDVGQLTDGPLVLAQMGPSLFLVYKERNRRKMRMTSYNLAPFNAFEAQTFDDKPDPANDTALHQWSPFDVHVGHFAKKMAALQNDYQALGGLAMATIEGEMHLVHRGAYEDTPQAYSEIFGLTGIFTAGHAMNKGWGTLDQAGWTMEQPLAGVELDPESNIAMTSYQGNLVLVWQPCGSKDLKYSTGGHRPKTSL